MKYTILFIVLSIQFVASSQPAPIFAGNDTTICEGDTITLVADNPWVVPISWNNGVTNGVPFQVAWTTEYVVTADNNGTLSYDTIIVTVEGAPIGSFTADTLMGCPPLSVNLINTTPNVSACYWTITNINSATSNNCNPNFVLNDAGTYDVTLELTSSLGTLGCSYSFTYEDYLYVDTVPTANFIIDTAECNPTSVTYTSTSSNAYSCVWNISNGDSYVGCGPLLHTYNNQGAYDVELITYSALGCSDTLFVNDAFYVGCAGLDELSNDNKELVRITNLLGQVTEFKPNTQLIYIYSDGSVKRVYNIE